jgi:hypothetical protein
MLFRQSSIWSDPCPISKEHQVFARHRRLLAFLLLQALDSVQRRCEGKRIPEQVYTSLGEKLSLAPERLKERYKTVLASCNYRCVAVSSLRVIPS